MPPSSSIQVIVCLFSLCLPPLVCSQSSQVNPPPAQSLGFILPMIVIVIAFGLMVWELAKFYRAPPKAQPEEKVIDIHGQETEFDYKLIIHVGCPSAQFDMQHEFVDVEVLGVPNDQPIGPQVRFDCARLPDQIRGEMHILIVRATAMSPISGIRVNHSSQLGSIYLYDYRLIDLSANRIIHTRLFNLYLTDQPTIYRGWPYTRNDKIDPKCCPTLPAIEWTRIEVIFISSLLVLTIGSVIMLAEHFDLYPINQNQDGSLYRSLLDVLYIVLPAFLLLALVTLPYKYVIKKRVLQCQCALDSDNVQFWQNMSKVFLTILVIVTLILGVLVIYVSLYITIIKSLYWLGGTLILGVYVLGSWFTFTRVHCLDRFFEQSTVNQSNKFDHIPKPNQNATKLQANNNNSQARTVLFQAMASSKHNKSSAANRSTGPKLVNPMKRSRTKQKQVSRSIGKRNKRKSIKVGKGAKVNK